jgi:hypothetical protein
MDSSDSLIFVKANKICILDLLTLYVFILRDTIMPHMYVKNESFQHKTMFQILVDGLCSYGQYC